MDKIGKLTVFYDGSCPLCAREISFYRRRNGADGVRWVDVSQAPAGEVAPNLSKDHARARFHVLTAEGALISGGAAFAELWAVLPGFSPWGRLLRARPFVRIIDRAYDRFLNVRPRVQAIVAHMNRDPSRDGSPPDPTKRLWAKALVRLGLLAPIALQAYEVRAQSGIMLIDDFADRDLVSRLGTRWRGVSDQVMGGVSEAAVDHGMLDGRPCLRLTGEVRLENDGGFIQAALDLASPDATIDASAYAGVRLVARGNGERYGAHLRTPDNVRPWQSYRAQFTAGPAWETIDLPFESFAPHRLDLPLDISRLRRIGLVAIGRAFHADLAVSNLAFYR